MSRATVMAIGYADLSPRPFGPSIAVVENQILKMRPLRFARSGFLRDDAGLLDPLIHRIDFTSVGHRRDVGVLQLIRGERCDNSLLIDPQLVWQ